MQLFIGRFFSFRPSEIPVITFSRSIYRDRLLHESRPGDRIAFVASKKEDQFTKSGNRLLGMAEIGRKPLDTLDVIALGEMPARERVGGQPRSPKAIAMLRAWRFIDNPLVPAAIAMILPDRTGANVIPINEASANRILSFPHEWVPLPETDALLAERHVTAGLKLAF